MIIKLKTFQDLISSKSYVVTMNGQANETEYFTLP